MEKRSIEGVDFVNRKVSLPADVGDAMKSIAGLEEFFYTQSFSCQKEYMESIADAKKPETRKRRIEKTVEMVMKLKEEKEIKAIKKRNEL